MQRILAWGLAGILLLSVFAAPIHLAQTPHHWCSLHNQFEHEHSQAEDESVRYGAGVVPGETEDADEHEACPVFAQINRHPTLAASSAVSPLSPDAPLHAPRVVLHASHPTAIPLLLAPKNGPPAFLSIA